MQFGAQSRVYFIVANTVYTQLVFSLDETVREEKELFFCLK